MEESLQIFTNEEFGNVRTVVKGEDVWFVGRDIALALGYSNPNDALSKHVFEEDKAGIAIRDSRQNRTLTFINESGVYALVFGSKLESAKRFKKWVTSEVLPSIRKHGAYMTENTIEKALTSPDFLIQLATKLKEEQEARHALELVVEESKPKVLFADAVTSSPTSVLVGNLAKVLRQNGINIGSRRLFAWLRENGYLIKRMSDRNMPTQRSMEAGLFEIKETVTNNCIHRTPMVTGKGQLYFVNKFLKDKVYCEDDLVL